MFTPPQLAEQWGVGPDKILSWIRSGELRALNVATNLNGRPRYRIEPESLEEFKRRRTKQFTEKQHRPKLDVIEYY